MEWYEKLDFDENPFSTDPRKNHDKLLNLEEPIEEMFYRINSGSMLVIEAPPGNGKTTLLMVAARKFGGRKKVVYVDAKNIEKGLNITHVLQERYGFFGRVFDKKPRNMILLLDNVDALSKKNTERIKFYFDQNYIRSIIFTTDNYKKAKFSDSLRDRIGKRVVKINRIRQDDAIEIIKMRIEDSELFNDKLIKKIFKISKKSVKLLLQNCTDVSKSAAKKNRKRVQLADFKVLKK